MSRKKTLINIFFFTDNKSMDAKHFWSNVKQTCKSLHITQETLAKAGDLNYRTMQNWMSRNILPDVISAYKIANVLNTTIEFLILGKVLSNTNTFNEDAVTALHEIKKIAEKYQGNSGSPARGERGRHGKSSPDILDRNTTEKTASDVS